MDGLCSICNYLLWSFRSIAKSLIIQLPLLVFLTEKFIVQILPPPTIKLKKKKNIYIYMRMYLIILLYYIVGLMNQYK